MDVSYNKGDIEFAKILLLKWDLLCKNVIFSFCHTDNNKKKE